MPHRTGAGRGPAALRRARQALLPFPGQALALLVLVAVLGAVAVSAPLMVASSAQGAWEQRESRIPEAVGTTLTSGTVTSRVGSSSRRLQAVPELDERVVAAAHEAGLRTPELTTVLSSDVVATGPASGTTVQLVSRATYDRLPLVAGEATEDGVLAPERFLEQTGLAVGDELTLFRPSTLGDPQSGTVTATLVGVYEDISDPPVPKFWQGIGDLVRPTIDPKSGNVRTPPPALVASLPTSLRLETAIDADVTLIWRIPAPEGLLVTEARRLAAAGDDFEALLVAPDRPVDELVQELDFVQPFVRTALPSLLSGVDRTVALLSPPVRAVGAGGALAALALVGAWAGSRARRRESELRALIARGLSPGRGGAEAALEAVAPIVVGLLVGGGLGWAAIAVLGPSPRLPDEALPDAVGALLVAGAAAALLVAAVTAAAVARLGRVGQGPAAQLAGRVPWLPVLAAVAAVTVAPLVVRARRGETGTAGEVDLLALVVPLLVVVVAAGAAVALLQRLAGRAAGPVRRLPVPAFLALRRVMAGPAATRLVVVTTALALGLVTYAGALADSSSRTIALKASVATGSDVVVELPGGQDLPDPAAFGDVLQNATVVGQDLRVKVLPGGIDADVLVVRPDQFADVVRWDPSLADRSLAELLSTIDVGPGGLDGRVPVIAAGDLPAAPVDAVDGAVTVDLGGYEVRVQVVARAKAFPGQSSVRPLLVAPEAAYTAALREADRDPQFVVTRQLWSRGDAAGVVAAVEAAGPGPVDEDVAVRTAVQFRDRPELVAQAWSLGYLRAVAIAAAVLGLVGVALHAAAQARQRAVASLLLARMGMSRPAAAASAALETGLLACLAAAVAVVVALPAAALVLRLLDPVPGLPPDPVVAVPWPTIGLVAVGVVLVAVVAGALAFRAVRAANPGQVMRDAD